MNSKDTAKRIRKLKECACLEQHPQTVDVPGGGSLRGWIARTWGNHDGWLLGHAYSGLLWGKADKGKIVLAFDANPGWGVDLDPETLLDLRLFNEDMELRLWRKDLSIEACIVKEEKGGDRGCFSIDERQVFMAGKRKEGPVTRDGVSFSLIEGPGGRQALPVDWDGSGQKYRLHVRHYLRQDADTGMLRIYESRLLTMEPEK